MPLPAHLVSHFPSLLAVAQYKSFTKAADSLHISQAAVSYQIRQLEEKLGLTLVVRQSGSKITLSNAGNFLAEEYRACDKRLRMVLDTLDPTKLQGVLRLTAPVDLGSKVIPHCLANLKHKAPKLKVELSVTDSVIDLLASSHDFAIRSHPTGDTLHHELLAGCKKSLVASPAYLNKNTSLENLQDIQQHTLLVREGVNRSWQKLFETQKISLQDCKNVMVLNNTFALSEAALAGLGLALLPNFAIADALKNEQLVPIFPELIGNIQTDFYVSYVPTKQADIIKGVFFSELKNVLVSNEFAGHFVINDQ